MVQNHEQLISLQISISTVFSNATFSHYKRQILHSHLGLISGLLAVSLASVFILDHYHQLRDNNINALTEAAYVRDQQGKNGIDVYLSYHSSIFSNLSRGLPINEGVTVSEPVNGQQGIANAVGSSDPADQDSQQEQIQESQPSISNNSQ
jgi:hypothetical protein